MATLEQTPTGAEPASNINDFHFEPKPVEQVFQPAQPVASPVGTEEPPVAPSPVAPSPVASRPAASPGAQEARPTPFSPAAVLSSPAAKAAARALPEAIAAIGPMRQKIDDALRSSRFSFVRRPAVKMMSWSNPGVTGTLLLLVTSFFVAHVWLAESMVSLALHAVLAVLSVSGALQVYKAFAGPEAAARIPVDLNVRIPVNRTAIVAFAQRAADSIADGIEAVNKALSWTDVPSSLRVLAYAWLASRFAFLASPSWLLFGFYSFAVLVPAYLLNQPLVDRIYTQKVAPLVANIANRAAAQWASIAANFSNMNGGMLLAAGGALFLYVFWSLISIPGLLTTASFSVLAYDWVKGSLSTAGAPVETVRGAVAAGGVERATPHQGPSMMSSPSASMAAAAEEHLD